jgi:release factor glutamine methyltransferase
MPTQDNGPWTVLRLINWTKDYLAQAGVEESRLCAEVLLAHVLGCPRIQLYTRFDFQPPPEKLASFRELVKRAAKHEPPAYLVGEKEFYSLRFKVTPDVLIPRAETELLVSQAVDYFSALSRPGKMWDVCTGSGCVAVATAVNALDVAVLATDISPEAVRIAEENASANGVKDQVRFAVADLLALPEGFEEFAGCDVITANPPYVAEGDEVGASVHFEPTLALRAGKDGLDCIRRIAVDAPQYLRPGGLLAMEFGHNQADAVRDLLTAGGEFSEPRILRDSQGLERAAVAIRR